MKIYFPSALNEIGDRSNNEDAIFPDTPSLEDELFLVCDGVGGQDKGEVASKLICNYFPEYFSENKKDIYTTRYLESGLQFVEKRLKEYIQLHPDCSGMASTLTLLYLSKKENKGIIGWVGDSRVYHIRNGEILFQTKDHSEVQSLVDMGEITEQEAEDHPRKNVITRAISGINSTRIDQRIIENIQPNDFFLLCTDGILENLNNDKIKQWFKKENKLDKIKSLILNNALNKTKDNFSMYLIKIDDVIETENMNVSDAFQPANAPTKIRGLKKEHILVLILVVLCLIILFYLNR